MTPRLALILVAISIVAGSIFALRADLLRSTPKMVADERPVVKIKARVLDSMHRYIHENKLFDRTEITLLNRKRRLSLADHDDDAVDYLTARASDRFMEDPGGIVLEYDHLSCPITLPAGRQFKFSHVGGFIDDIEAIFPLEPMLWDEMQIELKKLIALFDNAGWVRSAGKFTPRQPVKDTIVFEDFLLATGPKWTSVGFWEQCDNPAIKAGVEIRHYNSSSPGSFMPPAALSAPLDPTAEDTFLFLVAIKAEFESPVAQELNRLRDARRVEETGRPDQAIPLSIWLDDPDWRPEDWDGEFIE
ncbi:hypothetical protein [Roseobacter weihaiensis]|uniref:hypothetical protein n=1 Tax=Roseobacter weihaiensis TaxID=2763262 RepID=UPI001D0A8BED|nr:hypothetical protein [Roseobacter sp. H9]